MIDPPMVGHQATFERIARVLGVPISAFYDSRFRRHDDTAELLDLYAAITSRSDRQLVLRLLRWIAERQRMTAAE